MSKKRSYLINYAIMVNREEYHREFTVTGVKTKTEAEAKLRAMCTTDIVVLSNEEVS
jgi:hypothetical protein